MESEYNSLIENGNRKVVSPPTWANIITGRWVFKLKKDRFGNVLKYKARYVAHGYKQKQNLDYVNTLAAVVNPVSYKYLIAMGVRKKFRIRHMDVVDLRVDNKDAIFLTENPEFHLRTKQIEVRYHWIREKVESNKIQVSYVPTKDMITVGLTKPLNLPLFKKFRVMMEMN